MTVVSPPRLRGVEPPLACPGGLVTVHGRGLLDADAAVPEVQVGSEVARVTFASPSRVSFRVPAQAEGGATPVRLSTVSGETVLLEVGRLLATGVHQVDNPVFDREGGLYATFSGTRGEQAPVSIFRVLAPGARESFSSGIVNPTSMAVGPDDRLYVSSRFEGTIYRVSEDGEPTPVVTEVGVACGIAFGSDRTMFVGDRSGTLFRVTDGQAQVVTTLPPSVAAYHLAAGPDGWIYVAAPTLAPRDRIHRVHPDGRSETVFTGFGRPQGLAFDASGTLHVVEALAGASGLYRLTDEGPVLAVSGEGLIGVAFDPAGGLVLASSDTLYRFDRILPG